MLTVAVSSRSRWPSDPHYQSGIQTLQVSWNVSCHFTDDTLIIVTMVTVSVVCLYSLSVFFLFCCCCCQLSGEEFEEVKWVSVMSLHVCAYCDKQQRGQFSVCVCLSVCVTEVLQIPMQLTSTLWQTSMLRWLEFWHSPGIILHW